jgi:8-oxo-dGTP diphosphatase
MSKPYIKVVAAVIGDKQGRFLVTQRPEGQHLAGYWEFPGGRIEEGETPQEALTREIQEELAVNISVGELIWLPRKKSDQSMWPISAGLKKKNLKN